MGILENGFTGYFALDDKEELLKEGIILEM